MFVGGRGEGREESRDQVFLAKSDKTNLHIALNFDTTGPSTIMFRRPRGSGRPPASAPTRVDWDALQAACTDARATGRLPTTIASELRCGLASDALAPVLTALTTLDTLALNGGPTLRATLAADGWCGAVAAAAQTAPPAAAQALVDWGHAYTDEGLGARARDAAAGVSGGRALPAPSADARRARDAGTRGGGNTPFARGFDYGFNYLSLSTAAASAAAGGDVDVDADVVSAAVPRLTEAAARLRAAAADPASSSTAGDALEDSAARWARRVRDSVASGGGPGDPAALASLLAAVDDLNAARDEWRAIRERRQRGGGVVASPAPPLVQVSPAAVPPPAASSGSFWATFGDDAAPAATPPPPTTAPARAAAPPPPPTTAPARAAAPPPAAPKSAPQRAPPPPASRSAAAATAWTHSPALRAAFGGDFDRFAAVAGRVVI